VHKPGGYPIVLTADRSLMADYDILFDGMLTASQTTITPAPIMNSLLMPKPRNTADGRARTAPLGLRRVEAALLAGGFMADDVAVVNEDQLGEAIGPNTRIVGIAAGEPLGLGMNTNTMAGIMGGQIYPKVMFRRLLRTVHQQLSTNASLAKVIMGGAGAWQLKDHPEQLATLGIDHVISGYCEGNIAEVYRQIIAGQQLPPVIAGENIPATDIPPMLHPSTMGVVELSRGCGLGCSFCTIACVPMRHLPAETIIADMRTNIAAGNTSIAALSEDFFRYGAKGLKVNPALLIELLGKLRTLDGLKLIQIDHANVISIAAYSDDELRTVHDLLVGKIQHDYPWVNVGVETGSGELLRKNGGAPKMGTCPPEEWEDYCVAQLDRLRRAGFFPMVSLVLGLPGETPEDVAKTMSLVNRLKNDRISVFPMFYAPLDDAASPAPLDFSRAHWQIFKTAYEINFKWVPRMFWDNQAGAGVPFFKRVVLQLLGQGQVFMWRALFAWHSLRARS